MIKKWFIYLFLLSFVLYNLNFSAFFTTSSGGKGDTTPARLLPFQILSGRGVFFDEYVKNFYPKGPPFYLQKSNNHYVSAYPLLPGLISIPVYFPFYAYLAAVHKTDYPILHNLSFSLEKLSASLYSSITVGLFFILMMLLFRKLKFSIFFTLVFAFATQTFSVSSQNLWQHGFVNLFLILSQIFFLLSLQNEKRKQIYLSLGLFFVILCFWSRYSLIPSYSLIYIFLIYWCEKKHFSKYLITICISFLLLLLYNEYFFHTLLGSKAAPLEFFRLNNPWQILNNFLGVILSPNRGIIFFTPFYIFAYTIFAYWQKFKRYAFNTKSIILLNSINLFMVLLINSFWSIWWGGHGWGNRLLTDSAASAVILIAYFYLFTNKFWLRILIIALIFYTSLVQFIGTFYYRYGEWGSYPIDIDINQQKLWDYNDNLIFRSLALGPNKNGWYNFVNLLDHIQPLKYTPQQTLCSLRLESTDNFLGYQILKLKLRNDSAADWSTTNIAGYNLNLQQDYYQSDGKIIASPIQTFIPPVIKSGEEKEINILTIPPSNKENYNLVIYPVQDDVSSWEKSCRYEQKLP